MNVNKIMENNKIYTGILFAEFWEMFSFFGVVSTLVLYSTKLLQYTDSSSYLIYSLFITLFCGLPIIGGFLNDKFFSASDSLTLGACLMMLGNLLLSLGNRFFLSLGLALIVCGAALFKPICTSLIGKLTEEKSISAKEAAYSKFYVVLNFGAILSPILYGFMGMHWEIKFCFLLSSCGLFLSLAQIISIRKHLLKLNTSIIAHRSGRVLKGYAWIAIIILILTLSFFYYSQFQNIILIFIIGSTSFFFSIFKKQNTLGKNNLIGLLILLCFSMLFFTASLQVGSMLTLFIDRFIQRQVYSWVIPTSFFTALNPLFLVLAAPIFNSLWKRLCSGNKGLNVVKKLSLGLVIGGAGFAFFGLASIETVISHQKISLMLIVLGYLLLGAGEICFSPAVLNALDIYSPRYLKNTLMGAWYLCMAFSGYLGGLIDTLTIKFSHSFQQIDVTKATLLNFQYDFEIFAMACLILGTVLFLLSKNIKSLFFEESIYSSKGVSIKE